MVLFLLLLYVDRKKKMKEIPRFESYVPDRSSNYGLNSLVFYTSEGTFWFSYKTLIAFRKLGGDLVCRENDWGPTTGKHLNQIDYGDKKLRVDTEEFGRLYQEAFGGEA